MALTLKGLGELGNLCLIIRSVRKQLLMPNLNLSHTVLSYSHASNHGMPGRRGQHPFFPLVFLRQVQTGMRWPLSLFFQANQANPKSSSHCSQDIQICNFRPKYWVYGTKSNICEISGCWVGLFFLLVWFSFAVWVVVVVKMGMDGQVYGGTDGWVYSEEGT